MRLVEVTADDDPPAEGPAERKRPEAGSATAGLSKTRRRGVLNTERKNIAACVTPLLINHRSFVPLSLVGKPRAAPAR